MKEIMTASEVAEVLDYHLVTVCQYLRRGTLKGVKFGRDWMIKREDVESFVRPPMGRPITKTEG